MAAPNVRSQTLILPLRLHHYAWVTKDHEADRRFFEDVLGIPLVATWCEREIGRELEYCDTFYARPSRKPSAG